MKEYLIEDERVALEYLGNTFLKVPRSILDLLQSKNRTSRQMAQLHLLLFSACYHTDGFARLDGRKVSCRKGEYVGTQMELARLSGINITTVNRLLHKLAEMNLISLNRIQGGSRIRVNGYVNFTTPTKAEKALNEKSQESEKSLAEQLEAAKKRLGGRQMRHDNTPL